MEQRFCGKCGSQLDKKTGLCPICESDAIAKVNEKNNQRAIKGAKRKGFTAIIALILVIVLVITGVIFANSKGWLNFDDENKATKVQTTYVSYLNKTIIPQIGTYDSQHPESSNEGVHSALFCDLNNDKTDEFIVAYSKNDGANIDFNISCYEYDEKKENSTVDESESEETVELVGTVNPYTEPDYIEPTDESFIHISNATLVYSIEYEGKTYIVCEHISWVNTYSYECHIYTIDAGNFVEVGNLFVPDIGTDGTRIVYSSKMPEKLDIDNSDFDYNKAEYSGVVKNDGNFVMYFCEGGDSDYSYNKYYNSEDEAVSDYLSYYGINKNSAVSFDDIPRIVCPDGAEPIYSYVYYYEWNDDGDKIDKYEINDYTDIKSLIEKEESEIDNNQPDIEKIINSAADFAFNWFYDNSHTDKSKSITRHIEESWGEDDFAFEPITDKSIKSKNDLIKLTNKYFTESVTDNLMYYKQWYEDNNVLYVSQTDGLGDWLVDKYDILVEKETETKYILRTIGYMDYELIDYPHNIILESINGNWVLDEIFAFDSQVEINVIDEKSKDYNKYKQYYCYMDKLLDDYSNDDMYSLYDINNDGIKELITCIYDNAADAKFEFFTYDNGIVELGDVPAGYSALLIPNNDEGLYRACSRMDYYSLIHIKTNGSKLITKEIENGIDESNEKHFRECEAIEFNTLGIEYSDTLDPALYENLRVILN